MNINDDPERLIQEEQIALDSLVRRMDKVIDKLDKDAKKFVQAAKKADIRVNPDNYGARIQAQSRLKETKSTQKSIICGKDELYSARLLLHYKNSDGSGIDEYKVGLHNCSYDADKFVIDYREPVCRQFIMNNMLSETEIEVEDKHGDKCRTKLKLLVKNQIKLSFYRVSQAINLFPGEIDRKLLESIKNTDFFTDEYIEKLLKKTKKSDIKEQQPKTLARIISDEFLKELLERRTSSEFKNIVFSIQQKQGEIIQSPLKENMIVQGCAGSGKSMIMLHRLPILLFDNPNSLERSNLYIITPSQMYMQMVDKMRYDLEISDIKMGTIEQYYDYCIDKYLGHKAGEYGKIKSDKKIEDDNEEYVYSDKCIADLQNFYEQATSFDQTFINNCASILGVNISKTKPGKTYASKISYVLNVIQFLLDVNKGVLNNYYNRIKEVYESYKIVEDRLYNRKKEIIRSLDSELTFYNKVLKKTIDSMKDLDVEKNKASFDKKSIALQNTLNSIKEIQEKKESVNNDEQYFNTINDLLKRIKEDIKSINIFKEEFSDRTLENVYKIIFKIDEISERFHPLYTDITEIDNKYDSYFNHIDADLDRLETNLKVLLDYDESYLIHDFFIKIQEIKKTFMSYSSSLLKEAYRTIMEKVGIVSDKRGKLKALKFSPYLYLQSLYLFYGAPNAQKESLLSIDEAQGISPVEMELLKNVNSGEVVFNLFGDVNQHIKGTKGIEYWYEFEDIADFHVYEMEENYRNAQEITEYCNKKLDMAMIPINVKGNGVHEITTDKKFHDTMISLIIETNKVGMSAVIVKDDLEAEWLLNEFKEYSQKFNDVTGENTGLQKTRWNVINIKDVKGLEFTTVFVLSGRMTENEQYIAFTRALNELYVYSDQIDISLLKNNKKKSRTEPDIEEETEEIHTGFEDPFLEYESFEKNGKSYPLKKKKAKKHYENNVCQFFSNKGFEVIDKREENGRLWVVGAKAELESIVNKAKDKFNISGKYAFSKEIGNKEGWYTKTNK